jgi:FG-GAP-like repeat
MRHASRRRSTERMVVAAVVAVCLAVPASALAAPDTTIGSHPAVAANDDYARFDFSSTPSGASFECRRDGSAWAPCSSPKTYSGLTDGNHTFDVRAIDGTGTDPSPATWTWPVEPLNGMSVGVNWVNRGKYIWANDFGTDSQRQLLGDVTGDGRDDAVAFYRYVSGGKWLVSRSNPRDASVDSPGNGFVLASAAPLTGLGGGGLLNAMLGDVDGDGDEDIVAIDLSTNNWYVAESRWRNGSTGFDAPVNWAGGYGAGSANQFLADVTGDGKADAVVYSGGTWTVRASSGSGFLFPGNWKTGFGSGSDARLMGDATGDGTADAIVFTRSTGKWEVAPSCIEMNPPGSCSTPISFGTASTWLTGFGNDPSYPSTPLVGDVGGGVGGFSGDGRVDAVVYHGADPLPAPNDGPRSVWERAISNGSSFGTQDALWKGGHRAYGATWSVMLGNADGHMRDATKTYDPTEDPVIFENDPGAEAGSQRFGRWKFLPGEGKTNDPEGDWAGPPLPGTRTLTGEKYRPATPLKWNRWEADAAGPHPLSSLDVQGWKPVPQSTAEAAYPDSQYDAFDSGVLDTWLTMGKDAQIDYFTIDETNDLNTGGGFVWNRGVKLCQRIEDKRQENARYPRLAAAVGGFGTGTPDAVRDDARQVYADLATNPQCGATDSRGLSSGYMKVKNKPLIVLYLQESERDAFESSTTPVEDGEGPYQYVNSRFTIRWTQGGVEWHPGSDPQNPPDPLDYWNYNGTVWWDGSIPSSLGMGVMPGWKRQYDNGRYVARHVPNPIDKQFYDICGWRRIYSQSNPPTARPDIVSIEGFNGYGEQMALRPTIAPPDAGWYVDPVTGKQDTDWYWNRTKHWTELRKNHDTGSYPPPTDTELASCNH